MIIADTSGLYAGFDEREPAHTIVRALLADDPSPLIVAPTVVTELDHLAARRGGVGGEVLVLEDLVNGACELVDLGEDELRRARDVIVRHHDLAIGLTDATLVVLAERFDTRRILTLDHRHFSVIEPLQGGRFELLP